MAYRIVDEGAYLRIAFTGDVSRPDLEAAVAELAALEESRPQTPPRLIDLTEATESALRAEDLFWAASVRRALRFPNAFRAAVLAPRLVQFGYARMFTLLSSHPDVHVRAFRQEAEALAWICSQPPGTDAPSSPPGGRD